MNKNEIDLMLQHVTLKAEDGQYHIECSKGLWGVSAPTVAEATREALHFFRQYYADGEYDDS